MAYPYLVYIKSLEKTWPELRFLRNWMEVTTTPLKWTAIKEHQEIIRRNRAGRTKVAVIDFSKESIAVHPEDIENVTDLRQSLREKNPTHRLYVVEDLSRDVVEILGSELDIDPLFFREHISDYMWYNTRDPWVELPVLQVLSATRCYFKLRYFQARYFNSNEEFQRARKEAGLFNVLRRIDNDRNHNARLDNAGALVGLVRCKASFWAKPLAEGEGPDTPRIGVLLIDPPISQGYPLWNGYRNFNNPPPFSVYRRCAPREQQQQEQQQQEQRQQEQRQQEEQQQEQQQQEPDDREKQQYQANVAIPPRDALFNAFKFWTQRMSPVADVPCIFANPAVMAYRMAQIVCAEWLTVTDYITTRLGQIEWELENPSFRQNARDTLPSLTKLHPWRRVIPLYRTMFSSSQSRLFHTAPTDQVAMASNSLSTVYPFAAAPAAATPSRPSTPIPPAATPGFTPSRNGGSAHPLILQPSAVSAGLSRSALQSTEFLPPEGDEHGGLPPFGPVYDPIALLAPDYKAVAQALDQLEKRIERIAAVATAVISIDQSRRGVDDNRALGRLTVLLFVFAPLSFVASVLSMNSELEAMSRTLQIYSAVAVPVTVVAVLVARGGAVWRWLGKRLGWRM